MTSSGWRIDANCIGEKTSLFFPEGNNASWEAGKAICDACPVRDECLADALATEQPNRMLCHGLRGGLTPLERIVYRREHDIEVNRLRQRTARHGTDACYCRGCRRPECRAAHALCERERRAARQKCAS